MAKIFILVGPSSSGKDTILHGVKGFKKCVTHTTRPPRAGEKNGVNYYFTDDLNFSIKDNLGDFLFKKEYNVAGGYVWRFALDKKEIDIDSDNNYMLVLDYQGYSEMKELFGDIVRGFFILVDGRIRLERSLKRQWPAIDEQVKEMCRRYLDDEEVMAEASENLMHLFNDTKRDLEKSVKYLEGLINEH